MFTRNHVFTTLAKLTLLASLILFACATPALAAEITGSLELTGGSLTMTAADPPALIGTLTGVNQTVNDAFDINVKDLTGTGTGWKLTITSVRFATAGGKTLPIDASRITSVAVLCNAGLCTNPTNGTGYPLNIPADTTAPAAVTLFNATADTGMGDFKVSPTFELSIPASAYAGTYTSTITLDVATGP